MTAETADLGIAQPIAWRRAVAAFGITILIAAATVAGFALGYQQAFAARVVPGVTVGGVSIGGLDRAVAEAALRAGLPSVTRGALLLRSAGGDQPVPFSQLGRSYDFGPMLDAAMAVGHGGDLPADLAEDVRALVRGESVAVRLTYSSTALRAAVASAAASRDASAASAVAVLGSDGRFTVRPAAAGSLIDQQTVLAAAGQALSTPGAAPVVDLPASAVAPAISTAQAEGAIAAAQQMTARPLTLRVATNAAFSTTVAPATLRTWVTFAATPGGGYAPTIVSAAARAALAQLASKVSRAPTDATYLLGDGKVVGVLESHPGAELDVDTSLQTISLVLASQTADSPPPMAQLAMTSVAPALTTDEARKTAPLMTLVGSWTTHFFPGISNYWGKNISIPAAAIDGYVVAPGAWFDFWKVVGMPTLAEGYGMGGAIINGHTEETGAIAGGICSTSTTLFNAALRAGYEIGDRANHYYYISRYPVGLDATVAMGTGWEQDMTWRNDTAYPVLIHAINGPGTVTFQLFSVNPHRTVTLSTPIVKNYTYATTQYVKVTTLKPGQLNQVEYASNGFDAWVTRTVTDATGTVVHQETYYSHYATVNGLIQVGVASLPSPGPSASSSASVKP